MEMIGDSQVFAVELEWDRRPTYKPWMYGVFCVFIGGERLGSPFNQATLNSILATLDGWKETVGRRCDPALMAADPVTAFLSIEEEKYGLEHLEDKVPPGFTPIPISNLAAFEILNIDGLEDYRIYCVEERGGRHHQPPAVCENERAAAGVPGSARRSDRCPRKNDRTARRLVRAVAGAAWRALTLRSASRWGCVGVSAARTLARDPIRAGRRKGSAKPLARKACWPACHGAEAELQAGLRLSATHSAHPGRSGVREPTLPG